MMALRTALRVEEMVQITGVATRMLLHAYAHVRTIASGGAILVSTGSSTRLLP